MQTLGERLFLEGETGHERVEKCETGVGNIQEAERGPLCLEHFDQKDCACVT